MRALTERQQAAVTAIAELRAKNRDGALPTTYQLAKELGVVEGTARNLFRALAKKGLVPDYHEAPPKGPLPPRQAQVLEAVRRHVRDRGYPPTHRELGDELGIRSTFAVRELLLALERRGLIAMAGKGVARGIKLLEETPA